MLAPTAALDALRCRFTALRRALFDRAGAPLVVVNATLARMLAGGRSDATIGKRVRPLDPTLEWRTVVGVVADVRHAGRDGPPSAELHLPVGQAPFPIRDVSRVIRSRRDPAALGAAVRQEVAALRADQPLFDVQTMRQRVTASEGQPRFRAALLWALALLALTTAAIRALGITTYLVAQRTSELAIRHAVGAGPSELVRLVMRGAGVLVLAGVALGLPGAWGPGRLLAALPFGVPAFDGATVAAVTALLAAAALLAAWLPARRVARDDPAAILRAD